MSFPTNPVHEEVCQTGRLHRFQVKTVKIRFLRGPQICACLAPGSALAVDTKLAIPVPAAVIGKLFKFGKRPLDGELTTVQLVKGSAPSVDIDSGVETVTIPFAGQNSKKKILLWHGEAADLQGASWDDIALVNVTDSGNIPYKLKVTARCQGQETILGVFDILMSDPEGGGLRTSRYGIFKTRTPELTITTPNMVHDSAVKVTLDDGDEATDDELDITKLVKLTGEVNATGAVPGWLKLGEIITGITNTIKGRFRLVQPAIDASEAASNCAVFLYGENRLRIVKGEEVLFCAHSLHYLRDNETVPSGRYDAEDVIYKGVETRIAKNSLSLDFAATANDNAVSRTLHALRLPPRGFAGTFNLIEACNHTPVVGENLIKLADEIDKYKDPSLESVHPTHISVTARNETGFLERVPEALHNDFVVANHTFTNRDHHWHHFVIHTFPAHRLIESQLFPDRRPPQVALSGVNFETNKTFIRPEGAADIQRMSDLNAEESSRKIGIFGHTDRVGSDAANNGLSLVRARSLNALLRHNIGFWLDRFRKTTEAIGSGIPEQKWALKETGDFAGAIDATDTPEFQAARTAYRTRKAVSSDFQTRDALGKDVRAKTGAVNESLTNETQWGTREIQMMLLKLGHYAGPINGTYNVATKDAVKKLQAVHGLTQDGDTGLATRTELIRDYFKILLPTAFPDARFHANAVFGCGEAFPQVPTPDNVESLQNRRVEAIFRTNPVNPIDPTKLGAAVPYREWLLPEFLQGEGPDIPKVVVAIHDSGFGRGPADNFSGEQATQFNDLLIKGERLVKPTSVGAAAAGNPSAALVAADGDLRNTADVGPNNGHGSAVATCMAADGIGSLVAGVPRGPMNIVVGTAPHVKIRIVTDNPGNVQSFLAALEVIATDPDVLIMSSSVGFTSNFAITLSNAERRALTQRTQDLVMQGRLIVAAAANYRGAAGLNTFYHTSRTIYGSQAPNRANTRASNTGANAPAQRIVSVGNSARVGTAGGTINALTGAPGLREDTAPSSMLGEMVGVQMPGTDIRSIIPGTAGMFLTNLGLVGAGAAQVRIGGATGTSFAAPMTAGVAAELMLLDPDLRRPGNQVRVLEYIEATADPMQNMNPAGGRGAPANPRSGDPIIAGNAAHPAFTNLRRVHFWKAVLAALNKGISSEGRGANGATDARFTFCTLRDDSTTRWYGIELRSWLADAIVWFRKPTGEFILAEDSGALFPSDRIVGSNWRNVDAYQLAPGQPLPAFPWSNAEFTAAGRQPLFLCQISIEKVKLQRFQSIVLQLPGIDPRHPNGAEAPPILELRVDNRQQLRTPAAAGGAIAAFVTAFDDFVFHVAAVPQAFAKFVFIVQDNRTGIGVGETVSIDIYAVDAFGNQCRPPAGALTLSHTGTAGSAAPPAGVFVNGNPAAAAGTALTFGAGTDPASLARIQFQDHAAQTVDLSVAGHPGSGTVHVKAAGALSALRMELRRPAGGADPVATPPRIAEQLELVVRAVDAEGILITNFTGQVTLSLPVGQPGADGPPAKRGVHIKATEAAPFNAAAFKHTYKAADAGEHVFTFFNYTVGTVQFRATGGAITNISRDLVFRGGAVARFQVDTTTPHTVGNEFVVTVTALDSANNRVDDFEGAVTLATVPGKGTAAALAPAKTGVFIGNTSIAGDDTHPFSHEDGGTHIFPVTCFTAETVAFRATSGGITGDSRDVAIQAGGAHTKFRFEVRGADRAGVRFELRVIAEDAAGNKLPNFAGNVTLTLTTGTAFVAAGPSGVRFETAVGTAGASHTYIAADAGEFLFFVTPFTAETIKIRATAGGVSSDSNNIIIEGGLFDHFRVVPAAAKRNVAFNVAVTAMDQFNNVSPHFLGSVNLELSTGGPGGAFAAIAGQTHAFVDSDNSTFAYSVTLPTAGGNRVIRADDGSFATVPVTSNSPVFVVAP